MDSSVLACNSKVQRAFCSAAMETLMQMGPSVQKAVIFHLGRLRGVSSSRILDDPLEFSNALENIFSLGASLIEDKIIETMCKDLGVEYEKTKGSFEEKLLRICDIENQTKKVGLFMLVALEQTMR